MRSYRVCIGEQDPRNFDARQQKFVKSCKNWYRVLVLYMFIYPTDTAERVAPNKCYRLVTEGHVLFPTPPLDYTSQRVIVESHYTLYIYMHSMLHRA